MKLTKHLQLPNLLMIIKKYHGFKTAKSIRRPFILLVLITAMTLSLMSCGRVDEFVRQQKAVEPGKYVLEISESDDRLTPDLIKGSATLKVEDKKITGDYKIRYMLVDSSNTVIVEEGRFSSDELSEAFYPYSFDLSVKVDRQTFEGDLLVDEEKFSNKDSFRGTILDPSTGYGNFLAENTTTLDWEIKEIIK